MVTRLNFKSSIRLGKSATLLHMVIELALVWLAIF